MQETFSPFELLQQQEFCQRGIGWFSFNTATSHENGAAAEWYSTVVDPPHTHVSYRDPLVSGSDVSVHRTDRFAISCPSTNVCVCTCMCVLLEANRPGITIEISCDTCGSFLAGSL